MIVTHLLDRERERNLHFWEVNVKNVHKQMYVRTVQERSSKQAWLYFCVLWACFLPSLHACSLFTPLFTTPWYYKFSPESNADVLLGTRAKLASLTEANLRTYLRKRWIKLKRQGEWGVETSAKLMLSSARIVLRVNSTNYIPLLHAVPDQRQGCHHRTMNRNLGIIGCSYHQMYVGEYVA